LVAEDFLTLEHASAELRLDAEELKRLVSEGEIRAFRDANGMRFRRADLDAFKRARGVATVKEEEYPTEGVSGDAEGIYEIVSEPGMVTEEIPVESEPVSTAGAGVRSRRPGAAATGRRPSGARVRPARASDAAEAVEVVEGDVEPAWFRSVLIATSFVLFVGALVAYSSARSRENGLTRPISALFRGQG
jgi:excisionase family DNA binding protein